MKKGYLAQNHVSGKNSGFRVKDQIALDQSNFHVWNEVDFLHPDKVFCKFVISYSMEVGR